MIDTMTSMLYTAFNMNTKPNDPNEIFWGKEYSWRMDSKVNGWLTLAVLISAFSEIIFGHQVSQWPLGWRVGLVLAEFLAIALWIRAMVRWVRGMDELHRRITTAVVLSAVSATFFFMMLWHRLDRVGLFNAVFGPPKKPGASWDICTVGHGFHLLIVFYGIAQFIVNRRYK
jgi:hypothetical protein